MSVKQNSIDKTWFIACNTCGKHSAYTITGYDAIRAAIREGYHRRLEGRHQWLSFCSKECDPQEE